MMHSSITSQELDWEVELAVIIGKEVKRGITIDKLSYQDYIFGYTIGLDVSARDWQRKDKNGGQILIAKSMDAFLPLGTTKDISRKEVRFKFLRLF